MYCVVFIGLTGRADPLLKSKHQFKKDWHLRDVKTWGTQKGAQMTADRLQQKWINSESDTVVKHEVWTFEELEKSMR